MSWINKWVRFNGQSRIFRLFGKNQLGPLKSVEMSRSTRLPGSRGKNVVELDDERLQNGRNKKMWEVKWPNGNPGILSFLILGGEVVTLGPYLEPLEASDGNLTDRPFYSLFFYLLIMAGKKSDLCHIEISVIRSIYPFYRCENEFRLYC